MPTADGPALHMRVRAVPSEGAANAAAVRLLARWLDVPSGRVKLVAGGKARIKTLAIQGEADDIAALIAAKIAGRQRPLTQ